MVPITLLFHAVSTALPDFFSLVYYLKSVEKLHAHELRMLEKESS